MMKKRGFCFSPIAMGLMISTVIMVAATCALAADVVVVANKSVAQSSLSKDSLNAIFLGKMTSWKNGARLEFVTLKDNSPVHEDFLSQFIGRTAMQFSNYWKQQVFTGKGRMPKQFASESELIEYVSGTDGAIGYVSAGAAKDSVKIINIE
ncbi:MAG: substrate-binding domain-containing protein [Deltaproteobacteria bacterium]|nr:substrate-binding domain-containing protein [Deltaproteobacteria bacterium]